MTGEWRFRLEEALVVQRFRWSLRSCKYFSVLVQVITSCSMFSKYNLRVPKEMELIRLNTGQGLQELTFFGILFAGSVLDFAALVDKSIKCYLSFDWWLPVLVKVNPLHVISILPASMINRSISSSIIIWSFVIISRIFGGTMPALIRLKQWLV